MVKNLSACQCRRCQRCGFNHWVGKILWNRKWQPTPVFLLGESHGQRGLGCTQSLRVAKSQTRLKQLQFSSVTQSCPTLWPHGLQHTRLPCPSPTPGVYSNSCPLSRWCYPNISSTVVPFSSCLQSFISSGSFPTSQLFASGGPKY